jgi:GT2 family glycosyltransferase
VAAEAYQAYLDRRPRDTAVALRLAVVHLEAGELDAAESVVRGVLEIAPDRSRAHWLLGRVLEEGGRIDEAEGAYLNAIAIDRHSEAIAALRRLWRSDAETARPLVAPPAPEGCDLVARWDFIVNGKGAPSALIRATILSILALKAPEKWIWVIDRDLDQDAAVASLAIAEPRIRFVHASDASWAEGIERVVSTIAGAVLDAGGMEWLFWAYDQKPGLVYGDHDHARRSAQGGLTRLSSVFFPAVDAEDLRHTPEPPVVLVGPASMLLAKHQEGSGTHRAVLVAGLAELPVTHVPVTAASMLATGDELGPKATEVDCSPSRFSTEDILVVVPTRNMGALSAVMVESLWRRARRPEALHVLLIDNRSDDPSSLSVFTDLERRGLCEVLQIDEPFNWARLNNIAVEKSPRPILVFANNDMEMITQDWDERVREGLGLDGVGLIGARLLFPHGGVQHAGIALDAKDGEPLHEGLGAAASDPGPAARWIRRRPAAAVTGAFIAVSYDVFNAAGRFDELHFPISCNDIDFCLRIQHLGLRVFYDGQLELIHHESLTRGRSEEADKRAWVDEEMASLMSLWPEAARRDESRSPRWRRKGLRLFAGEKALSAEQVQDWVARTRHEPAQVAQQTRA